MPLLLPPQLQLSPPVPPPPQPPPLSPLSPLPLVSPLSPPPHWHLLQQQWVLLVPLL